MSPLQSFLISIKAGCTAFTIMRRCIGDHRDDVAMKPIRTWILIADGSRARIVLNEGPGKGLKPVRNFDYEEGRTAARDIMADRPGRTFDSSGPVRHAMADSSDPTSVAQARFAVQLIQFLDKEFANGVFDRLILAAPAKFLGYLRASISKTLKSATISELTKDLNHLPDDKLPKHFEDVLAL